MAGDCPPQWLRHLMTVWDIGSLRTAATGTVAGLRVRACLTVIAFWEVGIPMTGARPGAFPQTTPGLFPIRVTQLQIPLSADLSRTRADYTTLDSEISIVTGD